MTAFIHEVENLYQDYKRKQIVLQEVKAEIRRKIADNYFKWENQLRQSVLFTLSLYWGKYIPSEYNLPNKYSISQASKYNNTSKSFDQVQSYNIYNTINNYNNTSLLGYSTSDKCVGFVCHLKELRNILSDETWKSIWIYYLKDRRSYTGSLSEFKQKYANPMEFYELYKDYIKRKDLGNVHLFNYPTYKIKQMVLFIKD